MQNQQQSSNKTFSTKDGVVQSISHRQNTKVIELFYNTFCYAPEKSIFKVFNLRKIGLVKLWQN